MPKGGKAKYTIVIPIDDQYPKLSDAAHEVLCNSSHSIIHPHIEGPHQDGHHRVNHLVWIAPERPQSDTSAKHIATQIAEAGNVQSVHVLKEGKGGISEWTMRNPSWEKPK